MSTANEVLFKPLNSTNYYEWRPNMMALLQSKGLWLVVNGTDTKPATTTGGKKSDWEEKDMKAIGLIAINVSEGKEEVTNAETSKEAWDELSKLYDRKGLSMTIQLKTQLFRLQEENATIGTQITKIKDLTRRIKAIGGSVSDEDKIAVLFGSVHQDYSFIITAIQASWDKNLNDTSSLSFDTVSEALLNEEVRQGKGKGITVASKDNAGALVTSSWKSKKQGESSTNQGEEERRCWACRQTGHVWEKCPLLQAGLEVLKEAQAAKAASAVKTYSL
ncbi:hypothetical protein JCM5350_002832 [Sporobolomyces pararoseus]